LPTAGAAARHSTTPPGLEQATMIGYAMIWVIVLLFFLLFCVLFTITLVKEGLRKWRERGQPKDPSSTPPA
jgi:cell division protein FtsX